MKKLKKLTCTGLTTNAHDLINYNFELLLNSLVSVNNSLVESNNTLFADDGTINSLYQLLLSVNNKVTEGVNKILHFSSFGFYVNINSESDSTQTNTTNSSNLLINTELVTGGNSYPTAVGLPMLMNKYYIKNYYPTEVQIGSKYISTYKSDDDGCECLLKRVDGNIQIGDKSYGMESVVYVDYDSENIKVLNPEDIRGGNVLDYGLLLNYNNENDSNYDLYTHLSVPDNSNINIWKNVNRLGDVKFITTTTDTPATGDKPDSFYWFEHTHQIINPFASDVEQNDEPDSIYIGNYTENCKIYFNVFEYKGLKTLGETNYHVWGDDDVFYLTSDRNPLTGDSTIGTAVFDSDTFSVENINSVDYKFSIVNPYNYSSSSIKEVNYLKSDGGQYIDTDIKFSYKHRIDIYARRVNNANSALFGVIDPGVNSTQPFNPVIAWSYFGDYDVVYMQLKTVFSNNYLKKYARSTSPTRVVLDAINRYVEYGGNYQDHSITYDTYTFKNSIYLFGINNTANNVGVQECSIAEIYYFRVWENNVLVMDLIPASNNNKLCMYDKITQTCFYNKGADSFVSEGVEIKTTIDTSFILVYIDGKGYHKFIKTNETKTCGFTTFYTWCDINNSSNKIYTMEESPSFESYSYNTTPKSQSNSNDNMSIVNICDNDYEYAVNQIIFVGNSYDGYYKCEKKGTLNINNYYLTTWTNGDGYIFLTIEDNPQTGCVVYGHSDYLIVRL